MKKAYFVFTYHYHNGCKKIYGTVALKADGKISVSVPNPKEYSSAQRYQAKAAATKAAQNGFSTEGIKDLTLNNVEDQSGNKNLIGILTTETKEMHDAYIANVKKYAVRQWVAAGQHVDLTEEGEYITFGVDCHYVNLNWHRFSSGYYSSKELRPLKKNWAYDSMVRTMTHYRRVRSFKTFKEYEISEVNAAERHYADSIVKLADRLIKKGVVLEGMEIKTSSIGINVEIIIDCSGIITRAWTIVAEGPIQRAHYRYLVK